MANGLRCWRSMCSARRLARSARELLYPDDTVQHAGIVMGVGGIAEHAFRGLPAEAPGVCRQLQATRNYSAVTGACLLTRREVFEEVGGFDEEQLPVTFSDVDLCLKMRRAGYRNRLRSLRQAVSP